VVVSQSWLEVDLHIDQWPQTRGPRDGLMRPAVNFWKKISTLIHNFISFSQVFIIVFWIFWSVTLVIEQKLLCCKEYSFYNQEKYTFWLKCGPPTAKMCLMRPASCSLGLIRPPEPFEFETRPALKHTLYKNLSWLLLSFT
jgi:hypothetical protein